MEENSEINSLNNLSKAMALSKENEILNPQTKINDLSLDKGMGVESEEKPFLPPEIFSKILPYVEQFSLIRADSVCHSFKEEGDRIWKNRVLDLSGKLDQYTFEAQKKFPLLKEQTNLKEPTKRFIREKTFAALLNSERYKNICLKGCYISEKELNDFAYHNFKILDFSHNNILMYFGQKLSESFKSLNLSHCGMFGPIPKLGQLKELDLSYNYFSVNPLIGLLAPALKKLNLSYNKLSQETVNNLKETYKHLERLILEPQRAIPNPDHNQARNYNQYRNLTPHICYEYIFE
ncbi:MAG: hypothetical protein ACOH2E_04760 [Candidatus Paracaedibacter sp.]